MGHYHRARGLIQNSLLSWIVFMVVIPQGLAAQLSTPVLV
jgi:hypothetical protein